MAGAKEFSFSKVWDCVILLVAPLFSTAELSATTYNERGVVAIRALAPVPSAIYTLLWPKEMFKFPGLIVLKRRPAISPPFPLKDFEIAPLKKIWPGEFKPEFVQ